jgi:DNA-binding transcriptional ArsR family regulator
MAGSINLIAEKATTDRPLMSQRLTLQKTDVTAVSLLFNALSNEYRVGIANLLRNGPKNVGEISEALRMEQTMASHNLKCLAFCGLVTSQRLGKTIEYTLNRETVEPILRLADKHISKYAVNLRNCKTLER